MSTKYAYWNDATPFPLDESVRREARHDLDGCYAKRQLEAAKFLWHDGLRHLVAGEWAQARAKFELAQDKKDGWGWGVRSQSSDRFFHIVPLLSPCTHTMEKFFFRAVEIVTETSPGIHNTIAKQQTLCMGQLCGPIVQTRVVAVQGHDGRPAS